MLKWGDLFHAQYFDVEQYPGQKMLELKYVCYAAHHMKIMTKVFDVN